MLLRETGTEPPQETGRHRKRQNGKYELKKRDDLNHGRSLNDTSDLHRCAPIDPSPTSEEMLFEPPAHTSRPTSQKSRRLGRVGSARGLDNRIATPTHTAL